MPRAKHTKVTHAVSVAFRICMWRRRNGQIHCTATRHRASSSVGPTDTAKRHASTNSDFSCCSRKSATNKPPKCADAQGDPSRSMLSNKWCFGALDECEECRNVGGKLVNSSYLIWNALHTNESCARGFLSLSSVRRPVDQERPMILSRIAPATATRSTPRAASSSGRATGAARGVLFACDRFGPLSDLFQRQATSAAFSSMLGTVRGGGGHGSLLHADRNHIGPCMSLALLAVHPYGLSPLQCSPHDCISAVAQGQAEALSGISPLSLVALRQGCHTPLIPF